MDAKIGLLKAIGRFLGIVLLALLGIALIVAVIGWRMGWESVIEYGRGLQLGGMFVVGIGLLGIRGNWEVTRSFGYQYSMSTTKQSSTQRTQQILGDFIQSYTFMLVMFFAGVMSIGAIEKLLPYIIGFNAALTGYNLISRIKNRLKYKRSWGLISGIITVIIVALILNITFLYFTGGTIVYMTDFLLLILLGAVFSWLGSILAIESMDLTITK